MATAKQIAYWESKKGKSPWNKGRALSVEHRAKLSQRKLENPTMYWLGKKRPAQTGENSNKWKGDKVSYAGLHIWVSNTLGRPHNCDLCGNKELQHRQYHWANISGKYLREITDWMRLCVKCHKNHDLARINTNA